MNNLPLITMMTPVLNGAAFIKKAVDSVLAQNYPHLEYLIIDAGSTDGTLEILKAYGDQIILICDAQDVGPYDAYNKALKRARGEIIAMLSADDWLSPHALNKIGRIFALQPDTDMVTLGTQLHFLDKKTGLTRAGEIFHQRYYTLNLKTLMEVPLPNSRFVRKKVYEQHGFFKEVMESAAYSFSADLELMLRLSKKNIKNVIFEEPGYHFLVHANSITAGSDWKKKCQGFVGKYEVLKDFINQHPLQQQDVKAVEKNIQRTLVYLSLLNFFHAKFSLGKDYMKQGIARYGRQFLIIFLKVSLLRTRREFSILKRYLNLFWSEHGFKKPKTGDIF